MKKFIGSVALAGVLVLSLSSFTSLEKEKNTLFTNCETLQRTVESAYLEAGAGKYEAKFAGYEAYFDCELQKLKRAE